VTSIIIQTLPKKKINQETSALNCMMEQMKLTDIYRIFHPTAVEYTFFPAVY
jgi:exonuclease III